MHHGHRVVDAASVALDDEFDVIAVGSGAAGLAAAVTAAQSGASVLVVEKAKVIGGTTRQSGGWFWIPNNYLLRADGRVDGRDDFLRFASRVSRPQLYQQDVAGFGLGEREAALLAAFYDRGDEAIVALTGAGALSPLYASYFPDYAQLPENTCGYGRMLETDDGTGVGADGVFFVEQMLSAARALGVEIRTEHRVEGLVVEDDAVVGVQVGTPTGQRHLRARRGVIFGSGGFTHAPDLRLSYLPPTIVSGGAPRSNEGDLVRIATDLGVPLGNMNQAWFSPIPFEVAVTRPEMLAATFVPPGDSMLWVNHDGERTMNEKAIYNELGQTFNAWDPQRYEFPNRLMFMVWDQRCMDIYKRENEDGQVFGERAEGAQWFGGEGPQQLLHMDFCVRADSLDELQDGLRGKLEALQNHTGGLQLGPGFLPSLRASVARYNVLAVNGKDVDLGRGESEAIRLLGGPAQRGNMSGNPTMHPLAEEGPYYATIVCAGTLDTKGGPVTNDDGQVLDGDGRPVRGLYAAGNCAASPSGQAYWGAGATIGLALTFGYVAAQHACRAT